MKCYKRGCYNPAELRISDLSAFFLLFLKQKHYFVFIFSSPSVQHSKKPLDNYEKVLLFLHTIIIALEALHKNIQNTSVEELV